MVVPHLLRKINLGRTLSVRLDLDEAAASPIIRRNEDAVAAHDRRRRVGNVVGCARVLPQKLPIFQVESEPTLVSEEDDLGGVPYLDGNRRVVSAIAWLLQIRAPSFLLGATIEALKFTSGLTSNCLTLRLKVTASARA